MKRLQVGLLALACLLGAFALVTSDWPARWLSPDDPNPRVDAAVVFAGDPEYERTLTAVALVRSGGAHLLIVTGGYPGPGDSAQSLRAKALEAGLAEGQIHAEAVSLSTRECVLALKPVLDRLGIRSVAVVTSPFHQRRAGLAARAAWPGIRVVDHPARPPYTPWRAEGWFADPHRRGLVRSEYLKLAYYGIRGWLTFPGRS